MWIGNGSFLCCFKKNHVLQALYVQGKVSEAEEEIAQLACIHTIFPPDVNSVKKILMIFLFGIYLAKLMYDHHFYGLLPIAF